MAVNPSKKQESLESPMLRANPLNDPQFSNQQGYNVYDLNNDQILTPRFGEYTPMCVCETVPGDRHYLIPQTSSIIEQIDANVMSPMNEYHDHIFVPMRCIFPNNYEKLIPNPTKGDDLPWEAQPMIPLLKFLRSILVPTRRCEIINENGKVTVMANWLSAGFFDYQKYSQYQSDLASEDTDVNAEATAQLSMLLNSLIYVSCVLSRGQLLDYLGYCPELQNIDERLNVVHLEEILNSFFDQMSTITGFYSYRNPHNELIDLTSSFSSIYAPVEENFSLSDLRRSFYDTIEAGEFFYFLNLGFDADVIGRTFDALNAFTSRFSEVIETADPFKDGASINPMRLAAYQMSVAEYGTNDHIDNIYTAQLWMQNLRAIMFPSVDGRSREPIFTYNGVEYEYDLLTTGSFDSFMSDTDTDNYFGRVILVINQLFLLRRSLRYGDYFSTGRPNLVAVGQLGIPVNNNVVSPIDTIRSLAVQRFINAVNWVGSKFVNYMTSIFGVKPTHVDAKPIYIAHRAIPLERAKTTNTAQNQGKVTTNLYGESSEQPIDVYLDDFGVIISMVSYDAMPIYTTGIDRNFTNSDRYSMFNSMLQNVGDQDIAVSELIGWTGYQRVPFAYSARYSQYKFAISRAHGAAVNLIPSLYMKYPPLAMFSDGVISDNDFKINPNFIRDKPAYFDQFFKQRSGFGPGSYYHFIVNVLNRHNAARMMMYQPPVL